MLARHPVWTAWAVTMVLVTPTLYVVEDWRGYPLIDHHGHGWWVAAGVLLGFYAVGGALAGIGASGAGRAAGRAAAVVAGTIVVLLPADLYRRVGRVKNYLTLALARLWVGSFLAALAVAVLAAVLAMAVARHRRARATPGAARAHSPAGRAEDAAAGRR